MVEEHRQPQPRRKSQTVEVKPIDGITFAQAKEIAEDLSNKSTKGTYVMREVGGKELPSRGPSARKILEFFIPHRGPKK